MTADVYIVTGSSRGIGLAICQKLLEQPNTVVVGVSRSSDTTIKADNFKYFQGDIADLSVVTPLIKQSQEYGDLKALILNAGVLEPVSRIADANIDDWQTLYDINFFSNVKLISEALPLLRKNHGRVIAVSSGAATGNYTAWGAYGSSKAALNHLIGTLAAEEPDVFSVSIAPGVVDTQMQKNIRDLHREAMSEENHKKFRELNSKGNLLTPEIPGTIIANLALRGSGNDLNGKFFRYNADELANYK